MNKTIFVEGILEQLGVFPVLIAILVAFWKGDDAISSELRNALSSRLNGLVDDDTSKVRWIEYVGIAFEDFFGQRQLSLKCFLRSLLSSVVATLLIGIILSSNFEMPPIMLIWVFLASFVTNIFGDFFSVWETRYILGQIYLGKLRLTSGLAVDFALTSVIATLSIFAGIGVLLLFDGTWVEEIYSIDRVLSKTGIDPNDIKVHWFPVVYAVPFATTFITSFWIWLTGIGALFTTTFPRLRSALPVSEKPIRSLGVAATLTVFLASLALSAIQWALGFLQLV